MLRTAVDLGVTHIDTSDFYGPATVNQVIRDALHPYPADLRIVTKVGARRDAGAPGSRRTRPRSLTSQVHDNLRNLGRGRPRRRQPPDLHGRRGGRAAVAEQFAVLAGLREPGSSAISGSGGATDAAHRGPAHRPGRHRAERGTTWPTAGTTRWSTAARGRASPTRRSSRWADSPRCSHDTLDKVAAALGASPQQVALAWLLQRSSTITVIPGTSTVAHLRENIAAADLACPPTPSPRSTRSAADAGASGRGSPGRPGASDRQRRGAAGGNLLP